MPSLSLSAKMDAGISFPSSLSSLMLRPLLRLVALGLITCPLSSALQNQFVYVDAATGDDSNSGLSESDALQTLSAATTLFSSGSIEFVVAPGLYDAAHGESFPIEIRNGATIRHYPIPDTRATAIGLWTRSPDAPRHRRRWRAGRSPHGRRR